MKKNILTSKSAKGIVKQVDRVMWIRDNRIFKSWSRWS